MPPSLVTPLATDKTMQDEFQPVRYDIHHSSGSEVFEPDEMGRFVGYTDFLAARSSRDHWKGKAARWEAEAKSQENVIQNLERLLKESYAEADTLRASILNAKADVKRLTSIIDLNTDDKGRDLRALTEENARLRERLQCLGEPLTAPLTRYQR